MLDEPKILLNLCVFDISTHARSALFGMVFGPTYRQRLGGPGLATLVCHRGESVVCASCREQMQNVE